MNISAIRRMRLVSVAEGVSFLLLLGVAMPLKYLAGVPEPVTVIGALHGILFLVYGYVALNLMLELRWSPRWLVGALVGASLPFGAFVVDARLREREKELGRKGEQVAGG
jgi:integral membrane protein